MRKVTLSIAAMSALVLAACGGGEEEPVDEPVEEPVEEPAEEPVEGGEEAPADEPPDAEAEAEEPAEAVEAAELDCQNIQVIVPYSPGGGSDQQVRRLQPALEEALGLSLNITYQEGADGAVGWNALWNAEPDGCTIGNVVAPNIMNVTATGENIGFEGSEFEYIGWTEYSPNLIGVAQDARWETIEEYIQEAQENPGEITISGVGSNGVLLVSEVLQAIDAELTYVPVTGGVGDIIPQVAGGHIDSTISGFSLLDTGQIRPLALSGSETSPDLPDVPTFEEAGFPGVNLVTSWGLILPPETPEEIVLRWNQAYQEAMQNPEVVSAYEETAFFTLLQTPEEAREYFEEQREATLEALDAMQGMDIQ